MRLYANDYNEEIAQRIYRKKIIIGGLIGNVRIHKGTYKTMEEERTLGYEYIDHVLTQSVRKRFLYVILGLYSARFEQYFDRKDCKGSK